MGVDALEGLPSPQYNTVLRVLHIKENIFINDANIIVKFKVRLLSEVFMISVRLFTMVLSESVLGCIIFFVTFQYTSPQIIIQYRFCLRVQ